MMKLMRGEANNISEDELHALRSHVCPHLGIGAFIRWIRLHGRVFFNVGEWIEHCKQFDFVIGTRIHGVVVALQAGVPALCIVHDSRTLELCTTMKVPYVRADAVARGIRRESLLSLCAFDGPEFDANRRSLCGRYVGFLQRNRLQPARWLTELAAAR